MTGQNALFAPRLKHWLDSALEGEMDGHLGLTRQIEKNRRKGKTTQTVKSSAAPLDLTTLRTLQALTSPRRLAAAIVPKREVVLTPAPAGTETAFAIQHGKHLYWPFITFAGDVRLRALSQCVNSAMREWQNRPLESL